MNLPFFYIKEYDSTQKQLVLDEDTSRHVVQVLRMQEGEQLNLTDGKGNLLTCVISEAHKKHCVVIVKQVKSETSKVKKVSIAISLLKNTSRFEWFLEKATEIGVSEIIPLLCDRTEKQKFRYDRMQQICISAMLQSQQVWLPVLREPVKYTEYIKSVIDDSEAGKFIAHCDEGNKQALTNKLIYPRLNDSVGQESTNQLILVGPEGDFTKDEVSLAVDSGFIPVTLGETRLRTETAGVVAATLLVHS